MGKKKTAGKGKVAEVVDEIQDELDLDDEDLAELEGEEEEPEDEEDEEEPEEDEDEEEVEEEEDEEPEDEDEEVEEEEEDEEEEEKPKKKAKKEKVVDKKGKSRGVEIPEGAITTKELAAEFGMEPRKLRVILRAKFYQDNAFTRYYWMEGETILQKIRDYIRSGRAERDSVKQEKKGSKKTAPVARAVEVDMSKKKKGKDKKKGKK